MPHEEPAIEGVTHRVVDTGELSVHIAEAGDGPLVLLLHGFPESWYSWRHQLTALAAAGYHAVAPDQRGYGRTGGGREGRGYTKLPLVRGGHDWGAPVAWNTALLRPDRIRGVIGLSVPYTPVGSIPPVQALRALFT